MATIETALATPRKPIRVWPGVIAVVLQWLGWFVRPCPLSASRLRRTVMPASSADCSSCCGGCFSVARPGSSASPRSCLIVVALIGTKRLVHESIAGGAMGMLLYILAIPVFGMGLVSWAVFTRHFSAAKRRVALLQDRNRLRRVYGSFVLAV